MTQDSDKLAEDIKNATRDTRRAIELRVKNLGELYFTKFSSPDHHQNAYRKLQEAHETAVTLLYGESGLEKSLRVAGSAKEVLDLLSKTKTKASNKDYSAITVNEVSEYILLFVEKLSELNEAFNLEATACRSSENAATFTKNIRTAIQIGRLKISELDQRFMESSAGQYEMSRVTADSQYLALHHFIYSRDDKKSGFESRLLAAKDAEDMLRVLNEGLAEAKALQSGNGTALAGHMYRNYIVAFKDALAAISPAFQIAFARSGTELS